MKVSKGNSRSKTTTIPIELTYFESRATNPSDKLIINNTEYSIIPGFKIRIRENDTYRVISKDSCSYRVFRLVNNHFDLKIKQVLVSSITTKMFTNINLWMAVGNIADYLMYYFRSEQWNINESSGFIENNPILNNIIKEPINSISNLSYYLLCIVPTHLSKKYTLLHQTQQIAVNTMMYGSIFMHASNKHYGGFLDVLGMVYVFVFFIVKDLIIFGCIKNPNGRFMKLLPLSMLLMLL